MRSNVAFILDRMPLNLAESGTDILIQWDVITGGTFDPVLQTTTGGTKSVQSQTVKGFVHYVNLAESGSKMWNEFQQGDCIIDLAPDVVTDGKLNLRFTIDGQRWVQKNLGDKTPVTWNALAQGQRLYRSLLLRKAT